MPNSLFASETLLALSPDSVVVHSLDYEVAYWNAAAESLYGWTAEEMDGRQVEQVFYLDRAQAQEILETLQAAGTWDGELRQIDAEGNEHIVRSRQRLITAEGSEVPYVLCFNTDITEDKKRADAEARAQHVRSTSLLASGVAHELNNALAPILLSAAMLQRRVEDAKSCEMLSMIEKSANKGAELISNLLDYERGRGGGTDCIRRTQVERSLKRSTDALVDDAVDLQLQVVEDLWEFTGDLAQLSNVFKSVIQNACEAMPNGGSLSVDVGNRLFDEHFESLAPEAKAGAYVVFQFKDTGLGIDPALLDHVAEPFFTTKEPKQGYGFGLTNAQATVKGHQGFMVLDSEQGHGTTLTIFLPADMTVEKVKDSSPPFPVVRRGKGQLILVADDEFFVREMIKKTLEGRGYSVIAAQDGTEALAVFTSHISKIDLVVTNVEMPFMDGPALCRALKKLKPDTKILVSSGHKQQDKLQEIRACGVDQFLTKPYTADNLALKVGDILQG